MDFKDTTHLIVPPCMIRILSKMHYRGCENTSEKRNGKLTLTLDLMLKRQFAEHIFARHLSSSTLLMYKRVYRLEK